MANRHLSRSIVLQTLFEWDFAVSKDMTPEEMLERNIEEFGPGLDDGDFMSLLFLGVVKKKAIIDEIIEKAAPDWPIDKISVVDRNILRIHLPHHLPGSQGLQAYGTFCTHAWGPFPLLMLFGFTVVIIIIIG